jgi:hypothetical protein
MENKLTCVTGYWKVKNKHDNNYIKWFENTIKINCPYIVYGNKETIEEIKKHRSNLPTYYIEYNIEDFYTNKYKDSMIINCVHCPSVELNMIWNEKIIMIENAANINPFNSEFFCWIDAGICCLRNKPPTIAPFPDINKLDKLPKNKFIYSSSLEYDEKKILNQTNYHYISGTSYILHKSLIKTFSELYKKYMEKLINKNNIWTDQVILTRIFLDYKDLFYKLCDGYGEIVNNLY